MNCDKTENHMERLTTAKPTEIMDMTELALNCCYVRDGEARYRDYDTNINARTFARNLLVRYEVVERDDEVLVDDIAFDEFMVDLLQCDPGEIAGLIALFYRNLWAMAELYERLQKYEDSNSYYVPMAKARHLTPLCDNSKEKMRMIDLDKLMEHPWMHGLYHENANLHFVNGWKSCQEWIENQPLIEIGSVDLDEQYDIGYAAGWNDCFSEMNLAPISKDLKDAIELLHPDTTRSAIQHLKEELWEQNLDVESLEVALRSRIQDALYLVCDTAKSQAELLIEEITLKS